MEKGLVTIVIPVYNTEKYLDRCVKSVIDQTYKNLEVLLIDDGSPDKCPDLCDAWERKDKRIRVIHKKNAGLGMARNTGISNAEGEYIFFLDSDDYLALHAVENAVTLAKRNDSDIVIFGFSRVNADGTIREEIIPDTSQKVYKGDEIINVFLPDLIAPDTKTGKRTNLMMSAWSSLFSVKLIKEISWNFVSEREIISEDVYSLLSLYKHVQVVSVLSEPLYYYCYNEESLTNTYRSDRYSKIKYFYDQCIQLCYDCGYPVNVRERLKYPYMSNTIAALKMIMGIHDSEDRKREFLSVVKDPHLGTVLCSYSLKREMRARKAFIWLLKNKCYLIAYLILVINSSGSF